MPPVRADAVSRLAGTGSGVPLHLQRQPFRSTALQQRVLLLLSVTCFRSVYHDASFPEVKSMIFWSPSTPDGVWYTEKEAESQEQCRCEKTTDTLLSGDGESRW